MVLNLSQPQAHRDLLTDCYLWALHFYRQERVHIQHRIIIVVSFAWCGFGVGTSDWTKKGKTSDREPSGHRTKNTKPRNMYDIEKYSKDFEKGKAIMKTYGDPQAEMCPIGSFLTDVYEDTRLQNLTVGEPKPGNLQQIHDKILRKLECMAHARWCDARIGSYPIPFCCEIAILCKMYTLEELRVTGITIPSNLQEGHHRMGWPAGSEFEESDITDMEAVCNTTEESTDTEMAWHASTTLMISSDREKIWLEALTKEQDWAVSRALRDVQQCHLEEMQLTASITQGHNDGCSSYKCHSASCEEDVKRTGEESPEAGTAPHKRGRGLHRKSKADLQFLASPGKWRLGSRSFTPCMGRPRSRSETPGQRRPQSRHNTPSRHHSLSRSETPDTWCPHSRSSIPNSSRRRDSTLHTSRKWPVNHPPRPMEVTPTQSPAQKMPKLKSIIQWAPATQ